MKYLLGLLMACAASIASQHPDTTLDSVLYKRDVYTNVQVDSRAPINDRTALVKRLPKSGGGGGAGPSRSREPADSSDSDNSPRPGARGRSRSPEQRVPPWRQGPVINPIPGVPHLQNPFVAKAMEPYPPPHRLAGLGHQHADADAGRNADANIARIARWAEEEAQDRDHQRAYAARERERARAVANAPRWAAQVRRLRAPHGAGGVGIAGGGQGPSGDDGVRGDPHLASGSHSSPPVPKQDRGASPHGQARNQEPAVSVQDAGPSGRLRVDPRPGGPLSSMPSSSESGSDLKDTADPGQKPSLSEHKQRKER